MTRQPYPASLPYLPERSFPTGSSTHCPPKASGWELDSMVFPKSPRTPESEFGRESYDLPKSEVMHDPSRTDPAGVNVERPNDIYKYI